MGHFSLCVRQVLLAALILFPWVAWAEMKVDIQADGSIILLGLTDAERSHAVANPSLLTLKVAQSSASRGMLISVADQDGALNVTPRYPLRPGTGYTVTVQRRQSPELTAEFSIVAETTSAPRLLAFAPSQAIIPSNTLRLYLTFSEPMARGQMRNSIRLLRADGKEVPSPFLNLAPELWDIEQTRVTLFLDPGRIKQGVGPNRNVGAPLIAGTGYRLVVSGGLRSASGVPLGKRVELGLRVGAPERRALTPEDWEILAPNAGAYDPFTVAFDRVMDSGNVQRMLHLYGPDGQRVAGQVTSDGGGWSLMPYRPWAAGQYRLEIDPDLEDVAGNTVRAPFDAKMGTPAKSSLPVNLRLTLAQN